MTWPTVATKVNLDQASDDPKQARSELATLVDKFNQVQGQFTGISISAETRAAVETTSIATDVKTITTGGHTTAGDGGGATYMRGSEPSHNLKVQSADNAWWELVPSNGVISAISVGFVEGDSAALGAANVTAFNDFITYAQLVGNLSESDKASAPTLFFPEGYYHFNTHLNVKAAIHILGSGGWNRATSAGARLVWPVDSHGIIIHTEVTLDETTVASGFKGSGAILERLSLEGGGNSETTGHGIWMRGFGLVRNCRIAQFAENGVQILAGVGGGGATEGNANLWRLEGVQSEGNGANGIFVQGADSNAGYCIGADCRSNGRWGIFDSSFLGNTYMACHVDLNGVAERGGNPTGSSSRVHLAGRIYEANGNTPASEADLVATTPGTDETVWMDVASGSATSNIPTWLVSQSAGTYFLGGSYYTNGASSQCVFVGCYKESNQNVGQFAQKTTFLGGFMGVPTGSGAGLIDGELFGNIVLNNNPLHDFSRDILMRLNATSDTMIKIKADGDASAGMAIGWDEGSLAYTIEQGGVKTLILTSDLTTEKHGRDAAAAGQMCLINGFIGSSLSFSRALTNNTAKRTTGDRAKGDIEFNITPSPGSPFGWICTTNHASTPTFTALYGVGTQQSNIADPTGGGTVDSEARTAINSLIAAMEHFGFTST